MRIAFVGKGGSGKTTVTALFTQAITDTKNKNVYAVDADLNVHLSRLLGFDNLSALEALSSDQSSEKIKSYLKGNNKRIKSNAHFKKSTPPTRESNLIYLNNTDNFIFKNFCISNNNLFLSVVGTYEKEKIGQSCYHNNLSILENILSHSIDEDSYIVVDMVAGIDAFANTLHAQFDTLVLVVEPTVKSIEVFDQYKMLAQSAGIYHQILVFGNKVRDEKDIQFLIDNIDKNKFVGYLGESEHIRDVDRGQVKLDYKKLEPKNKISLNKLLEKVSQTKENSNARLNLLYELHKKYIRQGYIKDRFGDLTDQIDTEFKYE